MKSLQLKMQGIHKPYGLLKRIWLYGQFRLDAKSWRSVHSPFIFEFAKHVATAKLNKSQFEAIERLRAKLKRDKTPVTFKDYGADGAERTKTIAQIARHSAKAKKQCETLAKIVQYLSPNVALELGTSLGISYAYMATASPNATFSTIEGGETIAEAASNNLSDLGLFGNIQVGKFDDKLSQVLEQLGSIDFAFVDGNHQLTSTLHYFNAISKHMMANGCIIFDDIYWSEGMTEAWNRIHSDERVSLSIDCFHFGIVFFREGVKKQHFKLNL